MSCWVAPSVAAELWGCTVDAVLSAIRNGDVATREEAGWTFIDVAPDSPTMESPKTAQYVSATTEVVSEAEMEALTLPLNQDSEQSSDETSGEFDFRNARRTISGTRRAPLAQAA